MSIFLWHKKSEREPRRSQQQRWGDGGYLAQSVSSYHRGSKHGMENATEPHTEPVLIGQKLAPFNPTGDVCIAWALEMLKLTEEDVVFDLGCGDARFLTAAAASIPCSKFVGIEYDSAVYERARSAVAALSLTDKIELRHGNVLVEDFTSATAIFMYLLPAGIRTLKDRLDSLLDSGCRIVSYVFSIPDVEPKEVRVYKSTKLYLHSR